MRHAFVPGLVLGISVGVGLLTALPVAAGASPATSADPHVLASAVVGAVKIAHGSFKSVDALALPSGRWMVLAKVGIKGGTDQVGWAPTTCALSVGTYVDQAGVVPATVSEGRSQTLFMTASDALSTPGVAGLDCKTSAPLGSVRASNIHIMAIRLGTLETGPLGGKFAVLGSGSPRGIWGWTSTGPVLPGDGGIRVLGSLPIDAGRWWVIGKAWLQNTTGSTSDVGCALGAGDPYDNVDVTMGPSNGVLGQRTVSFQQTVVAGSATNATFACAATGGSITPSWIDMVAIRIGKLTSKDIGVSAETSGSGTPRVLEGHKVAAQFLANSSSYQNVGQMSLPAGRWAVEATGTLHDLQSGYVTAECKLIVGAAEDHVEADLWHFNDFKNAFTTQLLVKLTSSSHATIACRQTGNHQQVALTDLRIVAMRSF